MKNTVGYISDWIQNNVYYCTVVIIGLGSKAQHIFIQMSMRVLFRPFVPCNCLFIDVTVMNYRLVIVLLNERNKCEDLKISYYLAIKQLAIKFTWTSDQKLIQVGKYN